jgi:hypothetical protein
MKFINITLDNTVTYIPIVNITKSQKGACISGIIVSNHLNQSIKNLANDEKCFKSILKKLLYHNPFYNINEYMTEQ